MKLCSYLYMNNNEIVLENRVSYSEKFIDKVASFFGGFMLPHCVPYILIPMTTKIVKDNFSNENKEEPKKKEPIKDNSRKDLGDYVAMGIGIVCGAKYLPEHYEFMKQSFNNYPEITVAGFIALELIFIYGILSGNKEKKLKEIS